MKPGAGTRCPSPPKAGTDYLCKKTSLYSERKARDSTGRIRCLWWVGKLFRSFSRDVDLRYRLRLINRKRRHFHDAFSGCTWNEGKWLLIKWNTRFSHFIMHNFYNINRVQNLKPTLYIFFSNVLVLWCGGWNIDEKKSKISWCIESAIFLPLLHVSVVQLFRRKIGMRTYSRYRWQGYVYRSVPAGLDISCVFPVFPHDRLYRKTIIVTLRSYATWIICTYLPKSRCAIQCERVLTYFKGKERRARSKVSHNTVLLLRDKKSWKYEL